MNYYMNKIIILSIIFAVINSNTLFCHGDREPDNSYYHSNHYSFGSEEYIIFEIFGDIELR